MVGESELDPAHWRVGLLRIVLRVVAVLGALVYVPSVFAALKFGLPLVVWLDTASLAVVVALLYFDGIPHQLRAACGCLVFYALGAGLLIGVGSISQIYLFGFSLMTTLLLSFRWGLASVALNAVTMLAIGFAGMAAPDMAAPRWATHLVGWSVITANFIFVNACLVLALGPVLTALEGALSNAITSREALQREQESLVKINESLGEGKALLRIAGATARLGGWRVNVGDTRVRWSDEACVLHEVPAGSSPSLAEAVEFYAHEYRDLMGDVVGRCFGEGTPFDVEAIIVTAKRNRLWVRAIGNAVRDAAGTITHVHGSVQDISPQKLAQEQHEKLEVQLRQTQKMETFGRLAGGVAHDFNNLMSVVISYSELLIGELNEGNPMAVELAEIHAAGLRAAGLTRQLLAFSRQQVLEPRLTDLAEIVANMGNMLRRLIGEDIALATSCAQGLGKVLVDPGQIEQVIMNLAVNARDAMPRGGMLTIETANVLLDARFASEHLAVTEGPHVMLAVSDTGTGMSKATMDRMFEPFFTTKETGKGTGLGLATVFGIVQQSGGTIWAYSELEKGTALKIYFPIHREASAARAAAHSPVPETLRGNETILLVEDDAAVRAVTRDILGKSGYGVLEAHGSEDALARFETHAAQIDLLLTDVVMPQLSGRQLAEQLCPRRPTMKVLYMSGYTDDAVVRHGILTAGIAFLSKPVTPDALLRKVRQVLDSR